MRNKAKADEEKRKKEEADLLKPVMAPQKVPFGMSPKDVLCQYFKAGICDKGVKCKFSHDLNVGRKVEKKNLYEDDREEKMAGESQTCAFFGGPGQLTVMFTDTMDQWDEEKLRKVVLSKAGNPRTTTDVSPTSPSHPVIPANILTDCVQILHRSHRNTEVRSLPLSIPLFRPGHKP
jgi:hypothetical protein